jgi:DNA sulfur modification protein DndE
MQTKKGFVCIEGDNIKLKNATLITQETPVISVQNSKNLILDNIGYKPGTLLVNISGGRSKAIRLVNTDTRKASDEVVFGQNVSKEIWQRK